MDSSLPIPQYTLGLAWGLAAAGVVAQIAYPLTSGTGSIAVTVLSVVLLCAAALAHVGSLTGSAWPPFALLFTAGGIGWLAEVIGVHTGFPFGSYRYTSLLGPSVADVPLLVPLAWTMLAYPCLLLGRRLSLRLRSPLQSPRLGTAILGGLALASWDLFLDPQMVALGAWRWRFPSPGLPAIPGVPLTNYAGWVLVSVILIFVLDWIMDVASRAGARIDGWQTRLWHLSPAEQAVPAAVLTWTWLGSAVGNAVFFGRPAVALYGGLAMALLVGPYLGSLRRGDDENPCEAIC